MAATAAEQGFSSDSTFYAGVEVDNQQSQRLDLGMALESRGGTRFDLLGSRSEADADALDVSSTYAFGQLTHDFGRGGLGAGVRHMRDAGQSKTLGFLGLGFVDFAAVRLTASFETRSTDFDETSFDTPGADLGLANVTRASGVAACSIDSVGYGLGLNIDRPTYSIYASATTFDYSSYECSTTVTVTTSSSTTTPVSPSERAPVRITRPGAVTQLNSNVTRQFSGYSSTRVPREGVLLDSSLMMGGSFALGSRYTAGLELYYDSEEFAQSDTTTALAYLAFPLTRSTSMNLTLGMSESDLLDSTFFAGMRFTGVFSR